MAIATVSAETGRVIDLTFASLLLRGTVL